MAITLGSILEALGSLGSLLGRLWCHLGSTGLDSVPKWAIWHSCAGGSINLRAKEGKGELKVGRPVPSNLRRIKPSCCPCRIVDLILHHPAWAAAGMGHPGLLGLLPCCLGLDFEKHG